MTSTVLAIALASGTVRAQSSPWHLRETMAVGLVTSSEQVRSLSYDRPALLGRVQAGRSVLTWLELQAAVQGGAFFATKGEAVGGLLDLTVGATVRRERVGLSPYASIDLGPAVTSQLVRPYLSIFVGFDAPLFSRHRLGPVLGYGQVFQWNGPDKTSDARFLFFGISLRQQLGHRAQVQRTEPRPQLEVARPEPRTQHPVAQAEPTPDVLDLIERALPVEQTTRVELLAPVLFAADSDRLEPTGVAMLHEVRLMLTSRPEIKLVQIEGYADQRGGVEHNRQLSERRAARVMSWLVEHGVAAERLRIAPLGESSPVEPGDAEAAHQQNRRVIFRVIEQESMP